MFARAARARGERVRFLAGTDDHSLKNVLAAEAAGTSTRALRGPARRPLRRARRTARAVARRLHPHERRSAAPASGRAALARLRGGRRPVPRRVRRPLLRRVRGVLRAGRARRRALPGARHRARGRRRAQLVLPPVALPRRPRRAHHVRRAGDHAGAATATRSLAFLRRGLHDISVSRSVQRARGWGIPVPDDPEQVVYVWFDALANYLSAVDYGAPGSAGVRRVVDRRRTPRARHRQGHPALPRRVLAGVPAVRRRGAADGDPRPPVPDGRRGQAVQVERPDGRSGRRRRALRHRSPPLVADARHVCGRPTPTSPSTAWPLAPTRTSPTASATPSTASPPSSTATATESCRPSTAEPVDEASALPAVVAALLATFERRAATTAILDAVAALNRDLATTRPWEVATDPARAGRARRPA